MTLRVRLTGTITLEAEGYYVDDEAFGGRQWRLACAFLVSERHRAVERDELAEVLWPGELPSSWEPSLRAVVSQVRRFLAAAGLDADGVITHAYGCYQVHLPADASVDTEELARDVEAAEEAIRSGDVADASRHAESAETIASRGFLPGTDAPWAERKRDELRSWLVRALEVLAEARIATGDAALAVSSAEGALSIEPFRETAHRLLMRSHAATGNRAEALRAHERCRQLLSDELGVDPSPETEALYLRLLREEQPQGAPTSRADRTARTDRAVPAGLQAQSTEPFVGRVPELSSIAAAWAAAKEGRLTLVLVEGEPGIGKTRLASEAARATYADGGVVLYGRPAEEMGVPYLPFVEALRQFVALCTPGELEPSLGPLAGELVRLVPALRHGLSGLPDPVTAEPETERYRLFEAITGWLASASELAPILLVVDDLHWADKPTVLLLRHLLRSDEPMRVCLVGAYRPTDLATGHPLVDVLADLRGARGVERLALAGLSAGEVEALIGTDDVRGDPVATWVHAQTDGNPFYAGELVRHLVEVGAVVRDADGWDVVGSLEASGVPSEVRQLISWRTSRLPVPAKAVLAMASVLGVEFDVGLLVRLSDESEDDVLEALDHARQAGLVADAPGMRDRTAFVHALVRAAVYDELSGPRRMRLHLRAARALEPMPDPERQLAELAHHYAEAAPLGEVDRAVRYTMLAGERSREVLAFEQAATHLERALAILDLSQELDTERRCDIEIALGEALHRSGDPRHRDVLLQSAERARKLGDCERLGRAGLALNKMGSPSSAGAEDQKIVEILEESLAGLGAGDSELRARLKATLAAELVWSPVMQRRRELGDEAKAMARRLGPGVLAAVVYPAHFATSSPDNLDERIEEADELIRISETIGDREQVCRGHMIRVDALVEAGDMAAADEAIATAERLIEDLRQPFMAWEVVMRRAGRELLAGRLADVDKLVHAAYELGVERNVPPSLLTAVYGSQLLMLRFEEGRLDELTPLISSVADLSPTFGPAILAFALSETGQLDEAAPHFAQATAAAVDADHDIQWLAQMVMLAQVCAGLEDASAAGSLYPLLAAYPGRMSWVTSVACGPTDLGLGLLAATSGDSARGVEHLAASAELCERMGAEGWLARTRCEWARALIASRSPETARELAAAAATWAEEHGQVRVAERAKAELAVL